MTPNWAFLFGIFVTTGASAAAQTTVVTHSDNGANHVEITQTGPTNDKPTTKIRRGPGYVFIEQHTKNNSAVVIQGD
ncbi:MAG: hypothetical protein P4M15_13735 [Alphaproteobacteria bacterium]|nr:hypothetical protein [Alphaproteobacteria bacterium]